MKKGKNRLDEMQEQKMLRVEHNGYWIGYIGLAAAILIQILYYGPGCSEQVIGEFIVFMCLSAQTLFGCMKYGIWDRKLAPTWRVAVCASLVAGVVGLVFNVLLLYDREHTWKECVSGGVKMGSSIFVCCLIGMSLLLAVYRLRERKLEGDDDDNDEKRN